MDLYGIRGILHRQPYIYKRGQTEALGVDCSEETLRECERSQNEQRTSDGDKSGELHQFVRVGFTVTNAHRPTGLAVCEHNDVLTATPSPIAAILCLPTLFVSNKVTPYTVTVSAT